MKLISITEGHTGKAASLVRRLRAKLLKGLGPKLYAAYQHPNTSEIIALHPRCTITLLKHDHQKQGKTASTLKGNKINIVIKKPLTASFQELYDRVDKLLTHELTHFAQKKFSPFKFVGYPDEADITPENDTYILHPTEVEAVYYAAVRNAARTNQPIADFVAVVDKKGVIYKKLAEMAAERHPKAWFCTISGRKMTGPDFLRLTKVKVLG